jgi:hypothetical protein
MISLNWYDIITKQNYFRKNDKIVIQTDGLAMGTPSFSILSEMFLQHIEHTHITLPSAKTQTYKLLPLR